MSDGGSPNQSDVWMAEYDRICDELESQLVGVDGTRCGLLIETWERKHRGNPRVGSSIINHARGMQMMLRKNLSPGTLVVMKGDNLNFQYGTSNVSNASGNIAAGDGNQIVEPSNTGHLPIEAPHQSVAKTWTNIATGITAGLLAGWWCLPEWMAIGATRFVVTVVLVVFSLTMTSMSWFQFRRRNWEKFAYIGLGTVLILHSAIPSITGGGTASGDLGGDVASGKALGYVSFAEEPLYSTIEVVLGVVLLCLAFFTKNQPAE